MIHTYKLTANQREEAVKMYLSSDMSYREVAEYFGTSKQNIHQLVNAEKRNLEVTELKMKLEFRNQNN